MNKDKERQLKVNIKKAKTLLLCNESLYLKKDTNQIYLCGDSVRHYYQKWNGNCFDFIDPRVGDSLELNAL
jgi:hypothetical protein